MFVDNLKYLAQLVIVFFIIFLIVFLLEFDRGFMVIGMPGIIAYLVGKDKKLDVSAKECNFFSFFKNYFLSIIAISIYMFIEITPRLQSTSIPFYLVSALIIILGVSLCFTGAYYGLYQGRKLVKVIFNYKK